MSNVIRAWSRSSPTAATRAGPGPSSPPDRLPLRGKADLPGASVLERREREGEPGAAPLDEELHRLRRAAARFRRGLAHPADELEVPGDLPSVDRHDPVSDGKAGLRPRVPRYEGADDGGHLRTETHVPDVVGLLELRHRLRPDRQGDPLAGPLDLDGDVLPGCRAQAELDFFPGRDGPARELHDDVVDLHARLLGRASRFDVLHDGRLVRVLQNLHPDHEGPGRQDDGQEQVHDRTRRRGSGGAASARRSRTGSAGPAATTSLSSGPRPTTFTYPPSGIRETR